MTPAGQNYPIAEHSVLFWAIYLAAAIATTIALMGLFLMMVNRHSQATRGDAGVGAPGLPDTERRPTAETASAA